MKLKLITTSLLLFSCIVMEAQNVKIITDGVVEYDKTVNMWAVLPRFFDAILGQQVLTNYKQSSYGQFLVLKSTLSFSKDKTLFEPVQNSVFVNPYNGHVAQNNIIYTDLITHSSTIQKKALGDLFLLKEAVRNIKWKITDETREIAGFPCRRANALIMDSIYVVAFYTNNISVPGGPESFSGLPGMILQVSLPHENITWMATKVTDKSVPALKPPSKGKTTTIKDLYPVLEKALTRSGESIPMRLKLLIL